MARLDIEAYIIIDAGTLEGAKDKLFEMCDLPGVKCLSWLQHVQETAEATAQGDDQTEINHAIFTVRGEWEKGRLKSGKAGH